MTCFVADDLNESGLIDTPEELQQLTVNLLCKLNMPAQHVTSILDAAMGTALTNTEAGFTEEEFQVWFISLIREIQEVTSQPVVVVPSQGEHKPDLEVPRPHSLLIRIVFPSRSHNWPDSCAKVWVPVLYALACSVMFLQLAI